MQIMMGLLKGFNSVIDYSVEQFVALFVGIVPRLLILMTLLNAVVKLIGMERFNRFAQGLAKYAVFRYTLLPFLSLLFLGNPLAYSFGKFVKEEQKPAFYDAAVSLCHPIMGLFPHVNPGEYFVYSGIAVVIAQLGYKERMLAFWYLCSAFVIIFLRGLLTEKITLYIMSKESGAKSE